MKTESSGPLVSIITVNYNSTEVTVDLLRSIQRLAFTSWEVIVVDNASREDPTARLRAVEPQVRVIVSPVNLGFSGGNNLGIRAAKGEYLFLVNNDTELTEGLIEGLLDVFRRHPDAGMACPKFHFFYHPEIIEYAGYNALNVWKGSCTMVGNKERDEGQYDREGVTNFAHGGAMMVPAAVVKAVGEMPECYFLYYEELDWSEMLKRRGFRIYYQPRSLIYHKESMSVGRKSLIKTYYHCRNRILFMRRNVGPVALTAFTLYFIFFTIPKNSLLFAVRREWDHFKAFWRGIFWNLSHYGIKK
ncbi:MAG TPA: glycosyltransferase family 2 protein [Puia sp.]|nr:glycosyltransferase family 2 protein [Puia sp.]